MKPLSKPNIVGIYALLATIGAILLNLGAFRDYAFTDAYEFLWSAHNNIHFKNVFIESGRTIYGELNQLIFGSLIQTISGLKWIRFLSIMGSVLLSIQLLYFLLRFKFKKYEAALFSFLTLTIPSFGVYANWSVTYEIPIALNLSFLAGIFLIDFLQNKKQKYFKLVFALLLTITSLFTYQPAGTAFFIPLVLYFTLISELKVKQLISILFFFGLSLGLYYVLFKFSLVLYDLNSLNRSETDFLSLPSKIFKFYELELNSVLYGSLLLLKKSVLRYLGLVLFLGFFLPQLYKSIKKPTHLITTLFLLGVLPITYLPNLLSVDDWVCSRTIAPAAIIVLFFQFYCLRKMIYRYKIVKWISLSITIFIVGMAAYNSNVYFSGIQSKEYSILNNEFRKIEWNKGDKVILIRPDFDFLQKEGFYKKMYADEYGQISTSRDWVPIPFFKQVVLEEALLNSNQKLPKIETYSSSEKYDTTGAIVINMEEILYKEFSK